jgi:AcrR family transcriptional regulator
MVRSKAINTSSLIAAAAGVFERKGFRNATIDDVAESAGIARATLYKYVDSKQQLLDMIVDAVQGAWPRRWTRRCAATAHLGSGSACMSRRTPRHAWRTGSSTGSSSPRRRPCPIVGGGPAVLGPVRGRTTSRNSSSST